MIEEKIESLMKKCGIKYSFRVLRDLTKLFQVELKGLIKQNDEYKKQLRKKPRR